MCHDDEEIISVKHFIIGHNIIGVCSHELVRMKVEAKKDSKKVLYNIVQ